MSILFTTHQSSQLLFVLQSQLLDGHKSSWDKSSCTKVANLHIQLMLRSLSANISIRPQTLLCLCASVTRPKSEKTKFINGSVQIPSMLAFPPPARDLFAFAAKIPHTKTNFCCCSCLVCRGSHDGPTACMNVASSSSRKPLKGPNPPLFSCVYAK